MEPAREVAGGAGSTRRPGAPVRGGSEAYGRRRRARLRGRPRRPLGRRRRARGAGPLDAAGLERRELHELTRVADRRRSRARTASRHRLRNAGGWRREDLGHVERVAAGDAVQLVRIDVVPGGQAPHAVRGQRLDALAHRARTWRGRRARYAGDAPRRPRRLAASPRSRDGVSAMRRPTKRRRSSVASSAQCRSSMTATVGVRRSSRKASKTSWIGARSARRVAVAVAPRAAMSASGPSGRGVASASQAPQRTRTPAGGRAASARRTDDFPTPASPSRTMTWPAPRAADARA